MPHPVLLGKPGYMLAVLATRPTKYIRCNEASGTVLKDYASGGTDATVVGTPTQMGAPGMPLIEGGRGLKVVNGGGAYATAGNAAFPSTYSLQCWVNLTAAANTGMWGRWSGTNSGAALTIDAGPKFYAVHNGVFPGTPGNFATGLWHHVMSTWDGATVRLYVNGAFQNSSAMAAAPGTDSPSWHIGTYYNTNFTSRIMSGTIMECALWDRALSLGEIRSLYDAAYQ